MKRSACEASVAPAACTSFTLAVSRNATARPASPLVRSWSASTECWWIVRSGPGGRRSFACVDELLLLAREPGELGLERRRA